MVDIQSLRYEYKQSVLDEQHCNSNPIEQFRAWFAEAAAAKPPEPNAMVLSTVDADGQPSSRIVLLKSYDQSGFVFFTNYESRKGREIANNARVALLFYWGELERQIRIEGTVEKTARSISKEYFSKRPRSSQLGATISPQSQIISRQALRAAHTDAECKFPQGTHIPCPENWGGYLVKPTGFEFWQGRESRLHDRIKYQIHSGVWRIQRLAP